MSADPNDPKEIDAHSGVETTGHEWDGLKELNNPAPRWWLIVWMVTVIIAIGYWVAFPAWPTLSGHTQGVLGWTQYGKLKGEQAEIEARQAQWLSRFREADFPTILADKGLYEFARAGGAVAFKENCAACHGAGGEGRTGYPNLNDDDWLFGGTLAAIDHTIAYGSRSGNPAGHNAMMPSFGRDGLLTAPQIDDVASYVLALAQGDQAPRTDAYARGEAIFAASCVSCHGVGGVGNRDLGAPQLNDAIWLYGGDKASVVNSITVARAGVMPSWESRLDATTRKQLVIYVHSLGGGE